ncbi:hypothetical protein TPA0906_68400 [Streptomyces olivaceus]|nr:hypothetical protein TPA0906_68400 [Streptomyces olivaceus]
MGLLGGGGTGRGMGVRRTVWPANEVMYRPIRPGALRVTAHQPHLLPPPSDAAHGRENRKLYSATGARPAEEDP